MTNAPTPIGAGGGDAASQMQLRSRREAMGQMDAILAEVNA